METVKIQTDYIKLGQAMKLAGLVGAGTDAKYVIQEGLVEVNGEVDLRRGRKLVPGDVVSFQGESFQIEA
ncbi:MAG: RNA-binding S4 domain-containing protein [Lachnospiraceae bacterium]|nr:RNA-binding S4 domain-containing protein [Lachnospiraceae bacterium]